MHITRAPLQSERCVNNHFPRQQESILSSDVLFADLMLFSRTQAKSTVCSIWFRGAISCRMMHSMTKDAWFELNLTGWFHCTSRGKLCPRPLRHLGGDRRAVQQRQLLVRPEHRQARQRAGQPLEVTMPSVRVQLGVRESETLCWWIEAGRRHHQVRHRRNACCTSCGNMGQKGTNAQLPSSYDVPSCQGW